MKKNFRLKKKFLVFVGKMGQPPKGEKKNLPLSSIQQLKFEKF